VDILDDMGVSRNYQQKFFEKWTTPLMIYLMIKKGVLFALKFKNLHFIDLLLYSASDYLFMYLYFSW